MVAQEMTTIRSRGPILVSIVALAALLRPAPAVADGGGYKFRGSFARLDGSTAAGLLHATIGGSGSSMVVRARGLGDSTSLSLLLREAGAGDTAVVTFTSNVRGRATLRFRSVPRTARDLPLSFDPRGKRIVISAAGGDRLEVEVPDDSDTPPPGGDDPPPGGGTPPPGATCTPVDTGDVFLVPEVGAGTAKARFRRDGGCTRDFRVEADDVAPGSYDVCVGDVAVGSLEAVDNGGEITGEIELDDESGERPFPTDLSDPLGQRIEVREAATTSCTGALVFSFASFPEDRGGGAGQAGATCTPVDTGDVFLVREAGVGKAKARFRRQADCERDFRLAADDVPLGLYDVCIGGVAFGSFAAVDSGGDIEGELELDNQPDQPGERPFPAELSDPLGKEIEVRRSAPTPCAGTLLFSFASFPDDSGGS